MAFPNLSDLVTTTIESRSGKTADNVSKNNAILSRLKQKGKIRYVTGGTQINEEIQFAENSNFSWYSGLDLLPVAASDVLTSAVFTLKQAAVPVVISGLERLQNSGKEEIISLVAERLDVAEATMMNNIAAALYSDGTGYGGKQIAGLGAAVVANPTTGVYGGIDRALWPFWRNQLVSMGTAPTTANVQGAFNQAWAATKRGKDKADLILVDNAFWQAYMGSLQTIQRLTDPKKADLGFGAVDFMGADVVLDGGLGGFIGTNVAYFLNTDYVSFRPHKDRNFVPLDPKRRVSTNQDAEVQILAFAGAFTSRGPQFCCYLKGS